MKVPPPRVGSALTIKSRPISFSYWPTYHTIRRAGLHSQVYASDPWALIHVSVRDKCPKAAREEASASVEQAEFFYRSAVGSREWAAKPLPLYYCFMNLAKAFALTRGRRDTYDQARHGLSEKLAIGGKELTDAFLEAYPSANTSAPNMFAEFTAALGQPLAAKTGFPVPALLPQIVPGHRIWCGAANTSERFVAIDDAPVLCQKAKKKMWLNVRIVHDDLERMGKARKDLLRDTRLVGVLRDVGLVPIAGNRKAVQLEQVKEVEYTGRPADKLLAVVEALRPYVWSTVTTIRPFRRYYLYASPPAEHAYRLPQAASIYAITFYLGSITRYRPQHFAKIVLGPFGEFIQEFLTTQPSQFVYLMASDFAKRDVARGPLV